MTGKGLPSRNRIAAQSPPCYYTGKRIFRSIAA